MNSNNEHMYLTLAFVLVVCNSGLHAFPRPDSATRLATRLRHHHAEWVCARDGPGILPTCHASPQILWCGFPPQLRGTSLTDKRNVFYNLFLGWCITCIFLNMSSYFVMHIIIYLALIVTRMFYIIYFLFQIYIFNYCISGCFAVGIF